jgi:hypothetical protein
VARLIAPPDERGESAAAWNGLRERLVETPQEANFVRGPSVYPGPGREDPFVGRADQGYVVTARVDGVLSAPVPRCIERLVVQRLRIDVDTGVVNADVALTLIPR